MLLAFEECMFGPKHFEEVKFHQVSIEGPVRVADTFTCKIVLILLCEVLYVVCDFFSVVCCEGAPREAFAQWMLRRMTCKPCSATTGHPLQGYLVNLSPGFGKQAGPFYGKQEGVQEEGKPITRR